MPPPLDIFLRIRPLFHEVREREGLLSAFLEFDPADDSLVRELSELQESGVVGEYRQNGQLVFMPGGNRGRLDVVADLGKLRGYFETYDSLIASNPDVSPEQFVVWERNETYRDGYAAACGLLQFLKSKVEVWDTTEQRFFLVDQQAIEIPLTYTAQQTSALSTVLPSVTRFLDGQHLDADARWAFFRKASLRLLRDLRKEKRLGILMENIRAVFDRAQQDHSLYLERFSFEDLLKNFDEKRLKFVGDLNQVLSSIQTALIAVPIGFFLIAEKFKATSGWVGQNIILATGGIVFFALLVVLSLNQGKTLQAIKLALIDFETEQKKKVTDKSERLQNLLATTWSQYRRVVALLWSVRILLFFFLLIVVAALFWCSIPAWQKFVPYNLNEPGLPPAKDVAVPKGP